MLTIFLGIIIFFLINTLKHWFKNSEKYNLVCLMLGTCVLPKIYDSIGGTYRLNLPDTHMLDLICGYHQIQSS